MPCTFPFGKKTQPPSLCVCICAPLHFLPIPNTYALTLMAHVFSMLLFSAFIWSEFALNEVNFAQPNSSSYKICHKCPDLEILYGEKKSTQLHTTQLYLETDVLPPLS